VEFTGIELAGDAVIVAPLDKATIGPVKKVTTGLHIVQVERELSCA
jgi:hypothetical protein